MILAITGNGAANTLDGAGGVDTLIGGAGDDVYVVDVVGETVTEARCGRPEHDLLERHARERGEARTTGKLGLWLESDEDPVLIADSLEAFSLIAVNFPQFTDGRGYSTARLLRERYGWKGELRAIGDIQRDQLYYLSRCGFDSFLLNDGLDAPQEDLLRSAQEALSAFKDFSEAYQTAVDQPVPLFRRREKEAA